MIYEKRKTTIPVKTSHSINLDNEQTDLKISFLEFLLPKFMTLTFSLSLQERPPKPDIPWLTEHMWNTCCDLEVRLVFDNSTPTYSQRQNSIVLPNLVCKILNSKCNFSTGWVQRVWKSSLLGCRNVFARMIVLVARSKRIIPILRAARQPNPNPKPLRALTIPSAIQARP